MGAVNLGGGERNGKGAGGASKPKRTGFVLDMTPLVDVAFLLLTFFMFATTMSQPTVMDIRVPREDVPHPYSESEMWTIYVSDRNEIYYKAGTDPALKPLNESEIRAMAVQRNLEMRDANALLTVLRVDPSAQYAKLVEVLDLLNLAETDLVREYNARGVKRDRRFTISPIDENARVQLARL